MTESNFTLGALSPESAELIGQLDPVLGSIVASRQAIQDNNTSVPNFGSLLSDGASAGSSGEESLSDLDLGFYFGSEINRAQEEVENDGDDGDDEEEEELVKLIRPESSASSNTIDAISEQLEASLEDMIQTAQMHPRSLQVLSIFISIECLPSRIDIVSSLSLSLSLSLSITKSRFLCYGEILRKEMSWRRKK